jgi:glycosyltransferase involved in cell wall biosynthesis
VKVLALTRYSAKGASSRIRTLQYVDGLRARGIDVDVRSLFDDEYLTRLYAGRSTSWTSVLARYLARLRLRSQLDGYDVLWLEKEALPWLPDALERWLLSRAPPLVVDYDDAIFHRYDLHRRCAVRRLLGTKIDRAMKRAHTVTVGSPYLAERAHAAGARRVELLPSAVDVDRYRPDGHDRSGFVVGWIGTPQTARFLLGVRDALQTFSRARPDVRFVFVGCPAGLDLGVPYVARPWSEATEAQDVARFDCGIMPLPDEPFERGKCGYKLVQYMACGVPIIASPVGVNTEIVKPGENGYLAQSCDEWVAALEAIAAHPDDARELGRSGRERAEAGYSTRIVLPRLEALLRHAASSAKTRFSPSP